MKMAKASDEEIQTMRDFMLFLENAIENGFVLEADDTERDLDGDKEIMDEIEKRWGKAGAAWRRVIEGFDVLVHGCCDPDLDYLEWKPEIRAALNLASKV